MAQVYALLRADGALTIARQIAGDVEIVDAAEKEAGAVKTVFIIGEQVLSLSAQVNARNEAEARRAAPYAIEDDIAGAVEDLHVVLGPKPMAGDAHRRIIAVSHDQMGQAIRALRSAGIRDAELVAAHTLIPDGNSLVSTEEYVLGRLGDRSFALEAQIGSDVFGGLVRDHRDVVIYGQTLARDLGLEAARSGLDSDVALLETLIEWHSRGDAIDLRQGAYEVRRRSHFGSTRQWRLTGALAAVSMLGWLALTALQTQAMQSRTETLKTRIAEFTAAGWPEAEGNVVQAEAFARASGRGSSAGFPAALDMTAALYDALESVEASELRSLRYDRTRASFRAVVAYDKFADGDAIIARLVRGGLNARLGDARQNGSKVVSEITVEAAR